MAWGHPSTLCSSGEIGLCGIQGWARGVRWTRCKTRTAGWMGKESTWWHVGIQDLLSWVPRHEWWGPNVSGGRKGEWQGWGEAEPPIPVLAGLADSAQHDLESRRRV